MNRSLDGAGRLNQRFTFERRVSQGDGAGNTVAAFVPVFTCAAARADLKGGETVMASRLEGRQPVVLRIRASAESRAVTTDWMARDARSGETFNIRSKSETGDRLYFDMLCEAGVAEG
jgi:head-tail adaptor